MLHALTHSFPTRLSSDLLARHPRRGAGRSLVAKVEQQQFIQLGPPAGALVRTQQGALADAELRQGEGAGAVRADAEAAALLRVEHHVGVVDEMLRDGDLGPLQDRKSTRLNSSH